MVVRIRLCVSESVAGIPRRSLKLSAGTNNADIFSELN